MKLFLCGIILSITLAACVGQNTYDLAIENVDVFDSRNKQVLADKTILIRGDSIAAIIEATQSFQAKKTIKGKGRLVTPGFIDTHVHLRQMLDLSTGAAPKFIDDSYRKKLAEKSLAYGTTTVLDMGQPEGWMEVTSKWPQKLSPDYPNYFLTGSAMISDLSWNRNPADHHTVVASPQAGIEKVQKYAEMGLQHIKLYSKLESREMEAIIGEAQKQNLNIYAHVDNNMVTIPQAMELGVRNFEHFFTVTPSILNYGVHWKLLEKKYKLPDVGNIDVFSTCMVLFFQYIKETPEFETKLLALFDQMAKENVSLSTAIHVLAAAAGRTDFYSSFNHFPLRNAAYLPNYSDANKAQINKAFDTMMEYVKIAHDKGVKIRIGTDNRETGKAMISELLLLAEAGLPMEDVLQIATWNGATAMKLSDRFGAIEVGKKADIILFEKNPFANPEYLKGKKQIIKGGKEYLPTESSVAQSLKIIEEKGIEEGIAHLKKEVSKSIAAFELVEIGYHLFHLGKVKEGEAIVSLLHEAFPDFENIYNEKALNRIGYNLLGEQKIEEAVEIFDLTVEAFPTSSNAHDSLGEGYMIRGNKELAIKHYQKSVEIDPKNTHGIDMLKKLKNQ